MENHKHEVRVHIDQKPYESPNPTTGEALYKLGHVHKDISNTVYNLHVSDPNAAPISAGLP